MTNQEEYREEVIGDIKELESALVSWMEFIEEDWVEHEDRIERNDKWRIGEINDQIARLSQDIENLISDLR